MQCEIRSRSQSASCVPNSNKQVRLRMRKAKFSICNITISRGHAPYVSNLSFWRQFTGNSRSCENACLPGRKIIAMDLNKFAYKRRNEYHSQQDFGGNKENCRAENCLQPFTPIKASLTTVPETPEHHLPASPDSISTIQSSTYESGCIRTGRQRKKKCYRLSSSSSEEEDKANDSITPSRHNALFSGLPTSKRRKRTLEDESNNTEVLSVEPRSGEEMRSSINLCSDNGACPELNISVKVCDREKDLNTLHEMFPQYQKSLLKVILCDNDGDLDHAITSLISELQNL